jgi:hypothetical protein
MIEEEDIINKMIGDKFLELTNIEKLNDRIICHKERLISKYSYENIEQIILEFLANIKDKKDSLQEKVEYIIRDRIGKYKYKINELYEKQFKTEKNMEQTIADLVAIKIMEIINYLYRRENF